jgi:hypothetical protein
VNLLKNFAYMEEIFEPFLETTVLKDLYVDISRKSLAAFE